MFAFEPNWIDYRHSLVVVESRRDRGDEPQICGDCGCEVDIDPAPHSPKCSSIAAKPRRTGQRATEGLDLLERMDAGEPVAADLDRLEDDGLEEAPAEPLAADDHAAVVATADAGVSSNPEPGSTNPYGLAKKGRGYTWTREIAIQAVRDFATAHGRSPSTTSLKDLPDGSLPGLGAAAPLFGGWPHLLAAAGLEPNAGGRPVAEKKWPRERVIAAIQEVAAEIGRTPTIGQMVERGYTFATSTSKLGLGTWSQLVAEAGFAPNKIGGAARSEREPQADDEHERATRSQEHTASAAGVGDAAEEPSRSEHERRRAWENGDILAAIRRWESEYGHPPTSTEWMRRVDGYPTTATVKARFGSWADAIEQAGFPRPTRGGVPLRPLRAPAKRVRVRATGLTYATPEEAYMAADEIEADGQRVAEQARFDANETKAEQAIDQSRELAEKIRDAAHAFEARASDSGASVDVAKPEATAQRVEVASPFRAIAVSVIAGMRAAADALERELA